MKKYSPKNLLIFISTSLHIGGGEIVLKELLPEIKKNHPEFKCICLIAKGEVSFFLYPLQSIKLYFENNFNLTLITLLSLYKNINTFNNIYIISCSPKAFRASIISKIILNLFFLFKHIFFINKKNINNIKVIYYFHGKRNWITTFSIASLCDAVFSVSRKFLKKFRKIGTKSFWIPNSVKKQYFSLEKKSNSHNIINFNSIDRPIFLFLGRICKEKGIDTILKCANILDKKKLYPNQANSPLIVVSGKRMFTKKNNIEKKITEYSGNSLLYTGYLDQYNVLQILNLSRCLILPSLDEQFPLVIIEAQAKKKPVITCNAGDTSILVRHNKDGLIINKNSPLELANAILYLSHNSEKAKLLGENGHKRLKLLFPFSKWSQRFISSLYNL
jgi:glycosyltransferase involved in cell wall biosynthesis